MKKIILHSGEEVLVDDSDFDFLNKWKWQKNSSGYISRGAKINKKRYCVLMHRFILGINNLTGTPSIDHKNRNKLDNRRENLRFASPAQNLSNRVGKVGRDLPKGVIKQGDWFYARYNKNKKHFLVGGFGDIERAKRAYDLLSIFHAGLEFSCLHFPNDLYFGINVEVELNKMIEESRKIKKRKSKQFIGGTSWYKSIKKYSAWIRPLGGARRHLGVFLTKRDAINRFNEEKLLLSHGINPDEQKPIE